MKTRLEAYLKSKPVEFPDDIKVLRSEIPEIGFLSDVQIDELYSDFSTAIFAAGWMDIKMIDTMRFRNWLFSSPDPSEEMYPPEWYL